MTTYSPPERPILCLNGVGRFFGSLRAVDDVSFELGAGECHALIGPNGAGKSTLLHVASGALAASSGRILLDGVEVTDMPEHRRASLGLARTFQLSNLFDTATVFENVAIAAQRVLGVSARLLRPVRSHPEVADLTRESLVRAGLEGRAGIPAGELSHGERRQLEIAVALATRPRILLLDEPTSGMSGAEALAFVDLIQGLDSDLTLLVVEHDMDVVFALADRISVLNTGRLIETASPEEIRRSPAVREAYLGDYSGEAFESSP